MKKIKPVESTGTGLVNIKQRLEHYYPGKHTFEINKEDDQISIIIKIEYE